MTSQGHLRKTLYRTRVDPCILSRVEGLSKRYPSTQLRAGAIGALQQRHDTTSARLSARLRETISDFRLRIADSFRRTNPQSAIHNSQSEDLWALRDVSFEVQRGEAVGVPSTWLRARLKILSRITEPTSAAL